MNLPELLIKSRKLEPNFGGVLGKCFVCGRETTKGHKTKDTVSSNFTKFSQLSSGDCSCPECHGLFSDQVYRRKSWLATTEGFLILDKNEKKKILYNLPEPPFFFHIAMIGQKQPWVECIHDVAFSMRSFYFSHENYGKVYFEKDKFYQYDALIKEALKYKIGKMQLKGEFFLKTWENAIKYNFEDLLKKIEKCKKNLLWEVCVDVN